MKVLNKLAICALILPAGAFATGTMDQTGQADQASQDMDYSDSQLGSGMNRTLQDASYMTSLPFDAIRVDDVVGSTLHTRAGNEEVGTIDDFIINESGQIVAAIVSYGGMLGLGENTVAVSWDSIERTMNQDRDGYLFSVNATEDQLRNAPEFDQDSDGMNINN